MLENMIGITIYFFLIFIGYAILKKFNLIDRHPDPEQEEYFRVQREKRQKEELEILMNRNDLRNPFRED